MNSTISVNELETLSFRVREHIIRMSTDGGCFTGASLSCADLIVYLYKHFLDVSPDRFDDPTRDYCFLSKGHDVPALYGTFVELGWLEESRLENHLKPNDSIYWHPNRAIPGVEFYSGSLGHLLSVAMGVAYDCKLRGSKNKIVVIVGDGELNEGSIWEGLLVSNAFKLDNLVVVVDRNHFQANIRTEELIPLESIEDKFRAFGWDAVSVDGHDFEKLHETFQALTIHNGKPQVVVASTQRGRGLPSISERADRWFCNFSKEEVESLLKELHGDAETNITSEVLIVR